MSARRARLTVRLGELPAKQGRRRRAKAHRRPCRASAVLALLGHETGLGLVARLCTGGSMSIVRLTAGAHVTRQGVAKHLHESPAGAPGIPMAREDQTTGRPT